MYNLAFGCQVASSVDTIGKKCRDRGELPYLYKKTVRVLPLAMVDDLMGIANCGHSSLSLNTFINTQIELKKLKFHTPDENGKSKCNVMLIGNNTGICPGLQVHVTVMQNISNDTYLGDIVSADGRNDQNINIRVQY